MKHEHHNFMEQIQIVHLAVTLTWMRAHENVNALTIGHLCCTKIFVL
jgi:hypothetical protein